MLEDVFDRIDKKLQARFPKAFSTLNRGTKLSELEKLENTIGYQLPNDIRSTLLWHDGQDGGPGLVNGFLLNSVKQITSGWSFYHKMGEELHPEVLRQPPGVLGDRAWNPEWLFLMRSGRETLCVDCTKSAATEKSGPVFLWETYMYDTDFTIAESWSDFLMAYSNKIGDSEEFLDSPGIRFSESF